MKILFLFFAAILIYIGLVMVGLLKPNTIFFILFGIEVVLGVKIATYSKGW